MLYIRLVFGDVAGTSLNVPLPFKTFLRVCFDTEIVNLDFAVY